MYEGLFQSAFGGMGILAGIPNDPISKRAWEADMRVRHNRTVRLFSFGDPTNSNDAMVYALQDPIPMTSASLSYIGYMLRAPIRQLANNTNYDDLNNVIDLCNNSITATGLVDFTALGQGIGMMLFTRIFDGTEEASMKYIVMTATLVNNYLDSVTAISPHAVVEIRDHVNGTVVRGGCSLAAADHLITGSSQLARGIVWQITVGQCPAYEQAFVTWRRYIVIAACLASTTLAAVVCMSVWAMLDKQVTAAVQRTRIEEKVRAQQLVVGYICHELRNPLHIVRTAYQTVVDELCRLSGRQFSFSSAGSLENGLGDDDDEDSDGAHMPPTEQEMRAMLSDGKSALAQMQATVNDVLDYRSLEHGLSSLKINKQPAMLSKVRMSVVPAEMCVLSH